jgi:hypothetical protein
MLQHFEITLNKHIIVPNLNMLVASHEPEIGGPAHMRNVFDGLSACYPLFK